MVVDLNSVLISLAEEVEDILSAIFYACMTSHAVKFKQVGELVLVERISFQIARVVYF